MVISNTALLLNEDGSIYHLGLRPGDLAETIILVGDPARVARVSERFDRIEIKKQKREFITHTGYLGNQRLSVIGTGMGSGNIEIVFTEADALFNIDFDTRCVKNNITSLRFIRLGTSGALQENISVNSLVVSKYAIAFDGLLNYYRSFYNENEKELCQAVQNHFKRFSMSPAAYVAEGSESLIGLLNIHDHIGITLTANGFYGPQHRHLRAPLTSEDIIKSAHEFTHKGKIITNFEMETAAIYGMGRLLSHQCCSVNAIIVNRITDEVSQSSNETIILMIESVLGKLES